MRKIMFVNETEARETAAACADSLVLIGKICNGGDEAAAVAKSIADYIVKLSEALLYIYCCKLQSPDGILKFPTLRDIAGRGDGIAVPPEVSDAARIILRAHRDIGNSLIPSMSALTALLEAAKTFIYWVTGELDDPVVQHIDPVFGGMLFHLITERRL